MSKICVICWKCINLSVNDFNLISSLGLYVQAISINQEFKLVYRINNPILVTQLNNVEIIQAHYLKVAS